MKNVFNMNVFQTKEKSKQPYYSRNSYTGDHTLLLFANNTKGSVQFANKVRQLRTKQRIGKRTLTSLKHTQ